MEVDGAVADMAAAEVGDERLTEAVQERSAEEDRDSRGSGVGVDVDDGALSHIGRIEVEFAVGLVPVGAGGHADSMELEESGDDLDIADLGHAAQHGRGLTEQRGHHRLGHQVLGAADSDGAVQRISPRTSSMFLPDSEDRFRAGCHPETVPDDCCGHRPRLTQPTVSLRFA